MKIKSSDILKILGIVAVISALTIQGVIIYRQQTVIAAVTPDQLRHKLEIYVPSTVNINQEFDNQAVVEQTLRELAEFFGGSSAQEIRGCWISGNGTPVFEKPVICFVYCNDAQLEQGKKQIRKLAEKLRISLKQESVAIVIDGVMEFI